MKTVVSRNKKNHSSRLKKDGTLMGSSILGLSGFHLCQMYEDKKAAVAARKKIARKNILFI